MTLQRQHVTIVIGALVGQPPIYPQVGQGLLGGTIEQVHTGDSISQHKQLDELRRIFSEKFDRGEMSPGMLQRVLWESHWWRAILPVVQRAADLLHLASASGISPGGLASQRCAEIEAALTALTTERIPETPIGDALLSREQVLLGDEEDRWRFYSSAQQVGALRLGGIPHIDASALRADGIRPTALLTSEESQVLAEQIQRTAETVELLGREIAGNDARTSDERLQRLERLERGLMALADYIGEIPLARVRSAMERDV